MVQDELEAAEADREAGLEAAVGSPPMELCRASGCHRGAKGSWASGL